MVPRRGTKDAASQIIAVYVWLTIALMSGGSAAYVIGYSLIGDFLALFK
jgi:hypothetical protein